VKHCTSKIRDLGELRSLGGRTLGFRGEALAAVVEVAGAVVVTTRVEGETTGVKMNIGKDGQITKYARV
jgi:DNA mismatch repair ATPase MutL